MASSGVNCPSTERVKINRRLFMPGMDKQKKDIAVLSTKQRVVGYELPCRCRMPLTVPLLLSEQHFRCVHGTEVRMYRAARETTAADTVQVLADVLFAEISVFGDKVCLYGEKDAVALG